MHPGRKIPRPLSYRNLARRPVVPIEALVGLKIALLAALHAKLVVLCTKVTYTAVNVFYQ
jgi:hypothetical protein